MKQVISIFLFALGLGFFFPWWSVFGAGLLGATIFYLRPTISFFMGLLGAGLAWLVIAIFFDMQNDHILASKMAQLFGLTGFGWMYLVTFFVGGLVGGLGSLLASQLRMYIFPSRE